MNIKDFAEQALLSEASYADLEGVTTAAQLVTALENIGGSKKGFSPTQAADFVNHWEVVDHQPNTPSGFSATLFERLDRDHQGTGKYSLAIRGTEINFSGTIHDVFGADIGDIGADGIAISQAIDLFNYYQRLTAGPGTDVIQYSYTEPLHTGGPVPIDRPARITATTVSRTKFRSSELGTLSGKAFTVTGHSLGGHLALIMSRLDPTHVNSTYTYNAPGFDTGLVPLNNNTSWFFNSLAQLQTEQTGSSTVDTNGFDSTRLNNFVTPSDRISHIGTIPGRQELIFSEGSDVFAAHKIGKMVDSLAVQQLLNELDSTLDTGRAYNYLSAASAEADKSLETVTGSLAHLLGVALPTADNERENLYKQLASLREADGFSEHVDQLNFVPTLSLAAQAGSDSTEGLAYRYALEQLNPFAVVGTTKLYAPHNADGALNADHFSEQFLEDRVRFLSQVLLGNRADSHFIFDSPYSNQAYADLASGLRLATADVLADPHFTAISQWPQQADRLIFGSHAGDEIEGGDHDDHLYGRAGDDILRGHAGNDYLEGGTGNDLYDIQPGDGRDTLFDSDGQGRITIDGDLLTGGEQLIRGLWQSPDGRHRYVLSDEGTLYIDGRVRVEHFRDRDLGIELQPATTSAPAARISLTDAHTPKVLWWDDTGGSSSASYEGLGDTGNDLIGTAGGDDLLAGGDGNDWMVSAAGDDGLRGGDGNDALFPGTGADIADGGAGDDLIVDAHYRLFDSTGDTEWDKRIWRDIEGRFGIEVAPSPYRGSDGEITAAYTLTIPQEAFSGVSGSLTFSYTPVDKAQGAISYSDGQHFSLSHNIFSSTDDRPNAFSGGSGNDFIAGNAGDDILLGGADNDYLLGGSGTDNLLGGKGDDQLFGQQGADLLDGGSGEDEIYGGSGADIIHGGANDDTLTGDNDKVSEGADDDIFGEAGDDILYGNGGNDRLDGGSGHDALWGHDGDDVLDGGTGNDSLHAGAGTDILFGGGGRDWLYGEEQNDRLYGGDGKDVLDGGAGNDILDGGTDGLTDWLTGGSGKDRFIYHPDSGNDLIQDGEEHDQVILQGLRPADLAITLETGSAGDDLLALQVDADNTLYIKDGLTGGPDEYLFDDDTRLSRDELIAHMQAPLSYQMNETGELSGGSGDDALAGSMGNDRIRGHAGADTLAGSGGDDYLSGGTGVDRYLIGIGTGRDTLDENSGEASRLELLPGVDLDQVRYYQSGDDLLIDLPGGRDGARISGFFIRDQVWSLGDADGNERLVTPDSIASATQAVDTGQSISDIHTDFIQRVQDDYGNVLRLHGYQMGADGQWHGEFPWGFTPLQRRTNHVRYSVGFEVLAESPGPGDYIRSLPDMASNVTGDSYTNESSLVSSYSAGGTLLQSSQFNGSYIDLDQSLPTGTSGVRFAGTSLPVYGDTLLYNPLNGQMEAPVTGYMLYPDGSGTVASSASTISRHYTEFQTKVNILDLTLGADDNHFSIQQGYDWTFNLVDGGAGNDWLDASSGYERWERDPNKLSLPDSDHWSQTRLPGSLLYGNSGDDHLVGGDGEDELIGGIGNDYLQGGTGNDTYRVDASGMDVILEDAHQSSDADRLILPQGITQDAVSYTLENRLATNIDPSGSWQGRITSLHSALTISWSGQDGVTLVLPHTDQMAGTGIETVVFGDGQEVPLTSLLERAGFSGGQDPHTAANTLSGGDFLHGYAGDDTLTAVPANEPIAIGYFATYDAILIGGSGHDRLIGSDGDDLLLGNDIVEDYSLDFLRPVTNLWDAGNEYDGGAGQDEIWATAGNDLIHFGLGDGQDMVRDLLHDSAYLFYRDNWGEGLGDSRLNDDASNLDDPAALQAGHRAQLDNGIDILRFDPGITPGQVALERGWEEGLAFTLNDKDAITFAHWFDADLNQLKRVEFADGTYWNSHDLDSLLQGGDYNHQPQLIGELDIPSYNAGDAVQLVLPQDLFVDPEGDPVSYQLLAGDGGPLPDWLQFDADTRTLAGIAPSDAAGDLGLQVIASDPGGKTTQSPLTLTINTAAGDGNAVGNTHPGADGIRVALQQLLAHANQALQHSDTLATLLDTVAKAPLSNWSFPSQPQAAGNRSVRAGVLQRFSDILPGLANALPKDTADTTVTQEQHIRQRWLQMQQAVTQLEAPQAKASASAPQHHGVDLTMTSPLLGSRNRVRQTGTDPISLAPGDTQLRPFNGLAAGIQQLPW